MLSPKIKKIYEEHVNFGSGPLRLSKDEIRYLLKQNQESIALLLCAREAIAHFSVCDMPDEEEIVWDIADLAFIYKGGDGIIYVHPRNHSEIKPPICLSSFSLIDKARDELVAALEAVLPWLGKAIADDCFHNCSRPSAAESAFDDAAALLKRLRY